MNEVAHELMKRGNINYKAKDEHDNTALTYACKNSMKEVCCDLILLYTGGYEYYYARKNNLHEVINYIESKNIDNNNEYVTVNN